MQWRNLSLFCGVAMHCCTGWFHTPPSMWLWRNVGLYTRYLPGTLNWACYHLVLFWFLMMKFPSERVLSGVIWYCSQTVTFLHDSGVTQRLCVLPDSARNMLVGLEWVGLLGTAQGPLNYTKNVSSDSEMCLQRQLGLTFLWWMPGDVFKVQQGLGQIILGLQGMIWEAQ